MRLVGGIGTYSGRVEIYYNGAWNTVCDDSWENVDATVVCSKQGYRNGIAKLYAHYGQGTGLIMMDEVACSGHEARITDCSSAGFFTHNCQHSEDAGVECSSKSQLDI